MRFKIITAVYNAGPWFDRYVPSVANQEHNDYEVIIVDDASTDGTAEKVEAAAWEHGFTAILNDKNKGALYNQVAAIRYLDCEDDDVLVFVDGDDQLAHDRVLYLLESYYGPDTKLTYGQYKPSPPSRTCTPAIKYPKEMIEKRNFREIAAARGGIYWNHLRTFKYELFAQLEESDFLDARNKYYRTATDAALMYPCLELAAPHIQFIPEVLYIYTSNNAISDWRRWPRQCDRDHRHILGKKPKR